MRRDEVEDSLREGRRRREERVELEEEEEEERQQMSRKKNVTDNNFLQSDEHRAENELPPPDKSHIVKSANTQSQKIIFFPASRCRGEAPRGTTVPSQR